MNVQRPTAAVKGMAVQNVTAQGFTMNFGVDVSNPNTVELPLTAADYKVGLAGVAVANGTANPAGSIPAGGTKSLTLPVTLTYDSLLEVEQAIVKAGGDIPYAFDGGLSVSTGSVLLGSIRVPLSYSGTLALKAILNNPQAVMQSPAARKLARQLIGGFFGS